MMGLSMNHEAAGYPITRHRKLTLEGVRRLREELRRRRMLLAELAQYDVKRLAAKHGVSRKTIARLDESLHGYHAPDPSGPRLFDESEFTLQAAASIR